MVPDPGRGRPAVPGPALARCGGPSSEPVGPDDVLPPSRVVRRIADDGEHLLGRSRDADADLSACHLVLRSGRGDGRPASRGSAVGGPRPQVQMPVHSRLVSMLIVAGIGIEADTVPVAVDFRDPQLEGFGWLVPRGPHGDIDAMQQDRAPSTPEDRGDA